MISFSQYLQKFREAITLDNPEIESKMTWNENSDSEKSITFEFQGDRFRVTIKENLLGNTRHEILDLYARKFHPNYFEILFSSTKHHMNLSNVHGQAASVIYNFVAIAIKKMMEKFEQEGNPMNLINYFGVRKYTAVIYQRLFDMFLKNDYLRVHEDYIMKKTIFNEIANEARNLHIVQAEEEALHNKKIEDIKKNKAEERRNTLARQAQFYNRPNS